MDAIREYYSYPGWSAVSVQNVLGNRTRVGRQAGDVDVSAPGNVRHASEQDRGQWRARKPGAREEINYEDHNESHKTRREGGSWREALCGKRKEALNDVAGETAAAFCEALSLISVAHHPGGSALPPNGVEAESVGGCVFEAARQFQELFQGLNGQIRT